MAALVSFTKARPPSTRADLAFTWALGVIALVPRLFVALAWAGEPVWDGHYYHFGAERIAEGLGYSEDVLVDGQLVWKPWTHYPVGYSAFLGAVYRLFGSSIDVAPVFNAVVGTLTVVIVYRLARYMLSEERSRWAGAICALHPGLIVYSAAVMTEPLAALLLLGAAYAQVRAKRSWAGTAQAGLLLGLAALVRPASLLALPIFAFLQGLSFRAMALKTAGIAAIAILTILPWTIRNCRVMDGCALISTNGGWNLAIGALTTTGRFQTLRAADGCPIVTGQVQQDRCWAQIGMERIREAPVRWLALVPLKLSQTFDHESFAIEYLHEAAPEQWPEARRQAGRTLLTVFHWLLMTAASLAPIAWVSRHASGRARWTQRTLLGLVLGYATWAVTRDTPPFYVLMGFMPWLAALPLPGRPFRGVRGGTVQGDAVRRCAVDGPANSLPPWRVEAYLWGLLAVTTLTHAVFFGDDRYHLVITPALCILAGAALRYRPVSVRAVSP